MKSIIEWYYRFEECLVSTDLIIIGEVVQAAPDVVLIKGVSLSEDELHDLDIWRVGDPLRPPPTVTIEISSKKTWAKDVQLQDKPDRYAKLGVQEYFTFDPLGYWTNTTVNLRGWRYHNKIPTELPLENGRMWSNTLESWLVPEGKYHLRLYDSNGNLRLNKAGAESQRADTQTIRADIQTARAEAEAKRAEAEAARAAAETARAEAERARVESERAEAEAARAKVEAERAERLAAKLRELNIDPDTI